MTSLEQFLNKDEKPKRTRIEPASGSFACQSADCDEIIYEGFVDKNENRLFWICSQKHESSVVI